MRVLVTGAGGFLGRVVVRQLAEAGHVVHALVRTQHDDLPSAKNLYWVEMDLSTGLDTEKLPKALDGIVHLAQSNGYRNFPDGAADVFAINIGLVQQLCDYGRQAGISRMVLASSGTVYEPFESPMIEDTPLAPSGYYGVSKLSAEMLANTYTNYFSVANLRVFFLYGPGQKDMLIARLIDRVCNGESVAVPSDGKGLVFVPTFVDDTARAFVTALNDGWIGAVNVATSEKVAMRKLLETIAIATGQELQIKTTEVATPLPIVPDLGKLGSLIELSQFHTLEQGIVKTVA